MSLFQDHWGGRSPLTQTLLSASSVARQLMLTAKASGLLRAHCRAAIFFCFALIFSILAIEDKPRKPFSSPPVKTPLPFCQFLCLPFPPDPKVGQEMPRLPPPRSPSLKGATSTPYTQQPTLHAPVWTGWCSRCCAGGQWWERRESQAALRSRRRGTRYRWGLVTSDREEGSGLGSLCELTLGIRT